MDLLSFLIISFSTIQLIIALVNYLYLKFFVASASKNVPKDNNPFVSILIPARNEEKNIPKTLKAIISQNYTNIEIIVYDDNSNDRTKDIVASFQSNDSRIKLLEAQILPSDWKGKNYACHTLAQHAKGNYLLFLDADVTIHNDFVFKIVSLAKKEKYALISCFPEPITLSFGEKITVTTVYYILLSLLPLALVSKTKYPSISAANGQCMFFEADTYRKIQPHKVFKSSFVEDIDIARYFKKNQLRVLCLTGLSDIKCRMYDNLKDAINGFSKNIIKILGNNFLTAIVFWLITTFGFVSFILTKNYELLNLWIFQFFLTRAFISLTIGKSLISNLLLSPIQQFFIGVFIYKSFINKITKKQIWKGRNLYFF